MITIEELLREASKTDDFKKKVKLMSEAFQYALHGNNNEQLLKVAETLRDTYINWAQELKQEADDKLKNAQSLVAKTKYKVALRKLKEGKAFIEPFKDENSIILKDEIYSKIDACNDGIKETVKKDLNKVKNGIIDFFSSIVSGIDDWLEENSNCEVHFAFGRPEEEEENLEEIENKIKDYIKIAEEYEEEYRMYSKEYKLDSAIEYYKRAYELAKAYGLSDFYGDCCRPIERYYYNKAVDCYNSVLNSTAFSYNRDCLSEASMHIRSGEEYVYDLEDDFLRLKYSISDAEKDNDEVWDEYNREEAEKFKD